MFRRFTQRKSLNFDEYIERVLVTVPGMLHRGNIPLMESAIAAITTEDPVLEIGAYCGQSTVVLSYLLEKHKRKNAIWTVDPFVYLGVHDANPPTDWYLEHLPGFGRIARTDFTQFVCASWKRNTSFFCADRDIRLFEQGSSAFFQQIREEARSNAQADVSPKPEPVFAFCVIDGDHSYEAAWLDLNNCIAFTRPGTRILMDDTHPRSSLESARVAREAARLPALHLETREPNAVFVRR